MRKFQKVQGVCICGRMFDLVVEFDDDGFTTEDNYKVRCCGCVRELKAEVRLERENNELFVRAYGFGGGWLELLNGTAYLTAKYGCVWAKDVTHETENGYEVLFDVMKSLDSADEMVDKIVLDTYKVDQFVKKGEKK